jgi:hypothetical protein
MEDASLAVLFPRAMKDFIETQFRQGDPSGYIRSLIEAFSRGNFAPDIYRNSLSAQPPNRRMGATETRTLSFCKGRQ